MFGLDNLWGALGQNVSGFTQLGAMHYGYSSGLTQLQLEEQKQADIRKKEQQRKIAVYILIGLVILAIILISIFKK